MKNEIEDVLGLHAHAAAHHPADLAEEVGLRKERCETEGQASEERG